MWHKQRYWDFTQGETIGKVKMLFMDKGKELFKIML